MALCLLLALLLSAWPAVPLLAVAVLVPAGRAATQLFESRFHSAGVSRALDLSLAPDRLVGTAAVCASPAVLTALWARLTSPQSPRSAGTERPMAEASRIAD